MSERPILFSAPMVRALLAGTKMQTRRALKQATGPSLSVGYEDGAAELSWLHGDGPGHDVHETVKRVPCPYGVPGDRLWVRETMYLHAHAGSRGGWLYSADNAQVQFPQDDPRVPEMVAWAHHKQGGTCVSIHMPRWASRITLEVTDVRVERLQDISEADAIAEGIEQRGLGWRWYNDKNSFTTQPITSYRSLWESINDAGSWDANPWVWCVSFRRVAA